MIDRKHDLPITKQAEVLKISRHSRYCCFKCFETTAAKSYRSASDENAEAGMMIPIPLSMGRITAFFCISMP